MKTFFVSKGKIDATLGKSPLKGKNLLEPFKMFASKNKLPFSILEDTAVSNDAEVHAREGDLWFCLEGEAEFVCGGTPEQSQCRLNPGTENQNELYAKKTLGGTKFVLKAGDWLWIPAGEPH